MDSNANLVPALLTALRTFVAEIGWPQLIEAVKYVKQADPARFDDALMVAVAAYHRAGGIPLATLPNSGPIRLLCAGLAAKGDFQTVLLLQQVLRTLAAHAQDTADSP